MAFKETVKEENYPAGFRIVHNQFRKGTVLYIAFDNNRLESECPISSGVKKKAFLHSAPTLQVDNITALEIFLSQQSFSDPYMSSAGFSIRRETLQYTNSTTRLQTAGEQGPGHPEQHGE